LAVKRWTDVVSGMTCTEETVGETYDGDVVAGAGLEAVVRGVEAVVRGLAAA